mgnify:CR=1 FL=1
MVQECRFAFEDIPLFLIRRLREKTASEFSFKPDRSKGIYQIEKQPCSPTLLVV